MKKNWFEEFLNRFGISGVIFAFFTILIIGGVGGLFIQQLVLPYLSIWTGLSAFQPEAPLVVNRVQEIRIDDGVNQVDVVNQTKNSLVTVYQHIGDFDSGNFRVSRVSTGVIVSSDGLVLMPASEVNLSEQITMVAVDGSVYQPTLLAIDELTGLAILQIPGDRFSMIRQGFSADLKANERVFALWSSESGSLPFSKVFHTVYPGQIRPSIFDSYEFANLNSQLTFNEPSENLAVGSVMVNRESQLIALVTNSGLVRAEDVKLLLDNYLADQDITWPRLNLTYQFLGPDQTEIFSLPAEFGILIKSGSGKLLADDFVFEVAGQEISLYDTFQDLILRQQIGEPVSIKLIRDGEIKTVEISL